MSPALPRPLRDGDPIAEFDCGVAELNDWLAQRALSNDKRGITRTVVSIDHDTGKIAGFYSLSAWAVQRRTISGWLARNSPDPVPVILLGRLATSLDARGIGLGADLLTHAVRAAIVAAEILGARALVTEALDESAANFYRSQGLRQIAGREDLFALPLLSPKAPPGL